MRAAAWGAAELLQLVQKAARDRPGSTHVRSRHDAAPDLTKSASCVIARNRSSVWLTADCVTPVARLLP